MEKVINPKRPTYLFSASEPKGKMFALTDEELAAKLDDGWFDTPAHLELPENNDTGVTLEQVGNASPEDLVSLVTSYGFIVLTPEQLKAEANKMAAVAFDVTNLTDEALLAEAERRGLKESSSDSVTPEFQLMRDQFGEEPERLTKEELKLLGNTDYQLGLTMNMSEATMIAKITEAMNEGE